MPDLLFEKRDGVVWITLNRPHAKNALSPEAFCRLADAWTELRDDAGLRVAVLTGTGAEAFTSGGDLKLLLPLWTGARQPVSEWDRRLLADPGNLRLDGDKGIVTALFADLHGFTSYSEKHDPEVVFKVLNSYLSLAAQAILDEEGTLDKFMGDAVLAIWNSPDPQQDHALRAVRAALSIVRRSQEAHKNFSDPAEQMTFRIGINTGPAIIGTCRHERTLQLHGHWR